MRTYRVLQQPESKRMNPELRDAVVKELGELRLKQLEQEIEMNRLRRANVSLTATVEQLSPPPEAAVSQE
jgi:hypothetical protein